MSPLSPKRFCLFVAIGGALILFMLFGSSGQMAAPAHTCGFFLAVPTAIFFLAWWGMHRKDAAAKRNSHGVLLARQATPPMPDETSPTSHTVNFPPPME